jgi:hypothetical protein
VPYHAAGNHHDRAAPASPLQEAAKELALAILLQRASARGIGVFATARH